MTIPSFPAIKSPAYPLGNALENPAIRSAMENGVVVSRSRFTRIRETFSLRWTALPATDYALLRSFWKNIVFGGSQTFTWTYPVVAGDVYSGKEFIVRFNGDFHFDLSGYDLYSGAVTLEEV